MRIRRQVPSLDALRIFEVAARRLSFTEAAHELCVTQGAVSQRIKALELELGDPLFQRRKRGLALTPTGHSLALGVREAIERIHTALDADPGPRPLKISVLPSFASCWLMPRLHKLTQMYPALRVEILAQGHVVDLREVDVDLAIRFGPGQSAGLLSQRLMGDGVVPVCAPELAARRGPLRTPEALAQMPILHDSSTERDASGTDWASWFAEIGWSGVKLETGQRFGQADLAIEAAARGLGVALARESLIAEHLSAGRLVRLPLPSVPTRYAYHLIWRADADEATEILQTWLMSEATDQNASLPSLPVNTAKVRELADADG